MNTKCFVPNTTQQIEEIEMLGLKSEWMQNVSERALAAYNQKTPHDAKTAPGSYAYFAAVRSLRDILCKHGWEPITHKNVELVTYPETGVSLMVSSGNIDTGNKDRIPKTKNQKGNQTRQFVSSNYQQMICPTMERDITNISLSHTWMLLFYIDETKSQMRIELSLPVGMDIDEIRVSSWKKRIIINPIDFTNMPELNSLKQEFSPEVDIELGRKSNG